MKTKMNLLKRSFVLLAFIGLTFLVTDCSDSVTNPASINNQSNLPTMDKEAIKTIAEQDSAVSSFDQNYTENQTDNFLSKTGSEIAPFFVWQHVIQTDKSYDFNVVGDSVYVKVTKTFQGVLNIIASTQGPGTKPDTIVTKNFNSVMVRQLLFQRIDSTDNPFDNWKLEGISLVSGGTTTDNFIINKLTVTLSDTSNFEITSPEDYFISRGDKWYKWNKWHHFPECGTRDSVTVSVEVYSAYADTDFVSITYGANFFGLHRNKIKLELVSSTSSGSGFTKVYQRTFRFGKYHGYYHAVLNAFTRQSIYDDAAPVESKSWGFPYKVRD